METNDPATLLDSLDPARIQERLEDLGREAEALRVLLRAARARQRRNRPHPQPTPQEEVARGA